MTKVNLRKSTLARGIAILLSFIMCFTFIPFIGNKGMADAAASINIGDYVQMGTYYGEPILWRCVAFYKVDKDGSVDLDDTSDTYKEGYLPLMLSDKIICLKAFDAGGTVATGSHGRGYIVSDIKGYYRQRDGSNCWEDSNMRCWLNSTASAGNVVWTCGNPPAESHVSEGYNDYANEAGFLTNFTPSERNCMKRVTQAELLDLYEYDDMTSYGGTYHSYDFDIGDCVTNFDLAYKKNVTDTMFLLDVRQVNKVWQNGSTLGSDYYIGEPTAKCVAKSEDKTEYLEAGKKWHYWLRSPGAIYGINVRYVDSDGCVLDGSEAYYWHIGVRPAFYLNLSSANFASGKGTEDNPYTIGKSSIIRTIFNAILQIFGIGQGSTGIIGTIVSIFKSIFSIFG